MKLFDIKTYWHLKICTWHVSLLLLCDHQLFFSIGNLLWLLFLFILKKISAIDLIPYFQNTNKVFKTPELLFFLLTVQWLVFITIRMRILRGEAVLPVFLMLDKKQWYWRSGKSGGKAGLFLAHRYVQKLSNITIIWPNRRREGTKIFFHFGYWFKVFT